MNTISGSSLSNTWATAGTGVGASANNGRANQMQQRLFAKVDANGDGTVDKTELQGMLDKLADKTGGAALDAGSMFGKMDSDGSGSLSSGELDAGVKSLFAAPTSTVSFAQQRGTTDATTATSAATATTATIPAAPTTATTATNSGSRVDDLFSKLDGNGDGSIDSSELAAVMAYGPGSTSTDTTTTSTDASGTTTTTTSSTSTTDSSAADAMFDRLDTNSDGGISRAEFDAGKTQAVHGHRDSTDSTDSTSGIDALAQSIFRAADTDGDGTLNATETSTLKTRVEDALTATLGSLRSADPSYGSITSPDSSAGSASSQSGSASLSALLDKVLKEYGATNATSLQQVSGSLITASA